jgi:chemotaxis protein methyltransferase CheR
MTDTSKMTLEDIEIQLLIDAMYYRYGYDFRNYSRAHMKRRIKNRIGLSNYLSVNQLMLDMLNSEQVFKDLLPDFSINVTEMFRDPDFYSCFREEIIPILKTYPKLNIWHAGCSTGEEVYSMAIMLKEEGLYSRCQIYATDFNENVLKIAKEGIYPLDVVKTYTTNYIKAGGKESFSDYYIAKYESIILDQELKNNIIFAEHNLVTDGVFNEMHVIVCRNVMIYFDNELQAKVLNLFHKSLRPGGVLCLGTKESIKDKENSVNFKALESNLKIYRKRVGNE